MRSDILKAVLTDIAGLKCYGFIAFVFAYGAITVDVVTLVHVIVSFLYLSLRSGISKVYYNIKIFFRMMKQKGQKMSSNRKKLYDCFPLYKNNDEIIGYSFKCEEPKYVMCIIHGVGEYSARYSRMAEALSHYGIACIAYDQRGHGISKGKRGDCAPRSKVFEDIDALIETAQELYPGLPITLYGHSMGGNICLDYRARGSKNHIPEKYIVSAPWIKLVKDFPKPVVSMLRSASKIMPTFGISQSFPEDKLGNLINVRPYKDDPIVHSHISLRCAAECFDMGNSIYDGTNPDNGKSFGKPFLLMHGDQDKICSVNGSRHVAERLKNEDWFTYIEWPGYYHEIHNGGKEATGDDVIETIKDFILA